MPNRNGRRKSKAEVRAYKSSVKKSTTALDSTISTYNSNLMGSDELGLLDYSDSHQSSPIPWGLRVRRFLKKHVFETGLTIVVALLVALVGWYGNTLIDLKVNYAVLESKLEGIATRIDDLNTDNVTKEILSVQLEALEQELLHKQELDFIEVENRVELLEKQIVLVQETVLENANK